MNTRTPLIAGNWKMYKTIPEALETARRLVELSGDLPDVEVMIAPPFPALAAVSDAVEGSRISVGAQNLHWEKQGAFTGEISADMIVSAGCRHVIIGHSERRQLFGDDNNSVNLKIKAAITANLIPVFCIGETEAEREADQTFSVLDKQVENGLKDLVSEDLESLIVAYEPVWAIGTGKTATSQQAQEVHAFLRGQLEKHFGNAFSGSVRILYGGSVKPENISELMSMPDIDGALVGGASLDAETLSKIINFKRQT
jgi:triosephosphate isomerase